MSERGIAPMRTWLAAPVDHDVSEAIERLRQGHQVRYRITGMREQVAETSRISPRMRVRVLYRDGARCQLCGASPEKRPDVELLVTAGIRASGYSRRRM